MKKIIRLTETDLHKIIKESVKRIIKEGDFGGPDADLEDLYPDDFSKEDEEPLSDIWKRKKEDNL